LSAALAPHVERLLTPALVIDLDAVEHNVASMVRRVKNPSHWRPHVKTTKQRVVIRSLIDAGVTRLKCATVDELELVLSTADEADAEADVLVAYPLREAACRAVHAIARRHPTSRVHLLADSPEHARELATWAAREGEPALDLWLDVDLGMGRTGTVPETWHAALAEGLEQGLGPLRIHGLHGYDGHHGWDDRAAAWLGYDRLCELASSFMDRELELVTSGTHSYAHALEHARLRSGPWLHQVSPGTIVFSDRRSARAARDLDLRQAAFVASRVIHVARASSATTPSRVTLDAGSKGITPDGTPPTCEVVGWPGLSPLRASEEHLPVEVVSGPVPELGALLWLIPDHVCTTVNLYRHAVWLRGDRVVGYGPVDAASHPLWTDPPRVA
jgi:D-serine deaminase-like pyridoxal phosphate-dependent protein